MKYVLIDFTDNEVVHRVPIIFPDLLVHSQVAGIADKLGIPGQISIVGAGSTDYEASVVFGGSDSLDLAARQEDLLSIRYADSSSCVYNPEMLQHIAALDAERVSATPSTNVSTLSDMQNDLAALLEKADEIIANITALRSAASITSTLQTVRSGCAGGCGCHAEGDSDSDGDVNDTATDGEVPLKRAATTLELSAVKHKQKFVPQPKHRPRSRLI